MMRPLRKRHLQVWISLSIMVPIAIIIGYSSVPVIKTSQLLQQGQFPALPVKMEKISRGNYDISLRSDQAHSKFQLVWEGKQVLAQPSCLIYKNNKGQRELIGRVESKSDYFFPLEKDPRGNYIFVLYDIIHQQVIDSINFKP